VSFVLSSLVYYFAEMQPKFNSQKWATLGKATQLSSSKTYWPQRGYRKALYEDGRMRSLKLLRHRYCSDRAQAGHCG
jgi:hypothetical protein